MVRTIFGAGIGVALSAAVLLTAAPTPAQTSGGSTGMSFFVTSVGSGKGADLGGLEGADRHCRQLAQAVGAGNRDWKAYLSTQAADGRPAVNARDRIGAGPWQNAKGQVIARNVEDLHATNGLTKQTGLTETGEMVKGRGDTPNTHDILTGSQPDGTAFGGAEDRTCGNWTRSGTEGAAMVGHHDRMGLGDDPPAKSWNSSHLTRGGCSQDALKSTGGAGLLYCFAAD
ncbi:hypothetical protein H1Q64_10080 [Azospirillum brasilense]|nr:hypothetical protein H1Q64_10080 [Azospirillum brasilense]